MCRTISHKANCSEINHKNKAVMNWGFAILYSHRLANVRRFIRRILSLITHASPHATFKKTTATGGGVNEREKQESPAG